MRRFLVRKIAIVAGVAALVAASGAVPHQASAEPGPPPDVRERRVLTTEHVDAINVAYDGERLAVDSKIGPPVEHVEVGELIYHLSDRGRIEGLPPQYAEFLGADSAWVITQTQNPEVLWAGWSTEQIGSGVVDGDAVDITLTDVRGPGAVEVFQNDAFGSPIRIFSSDEDYKTLRQGVNAHVHANWAFTQPGVYSLTFTVSAAVGGQHVTSGPVDYTWVVGGSGGTLPEPASSSTSLDVSATATVGEEVVLEAGVAIDAGDGAPPAPGGYIEFHDGETSLGWTALTDGRAVLPATFDEPGDHAITATYTSQEPQFYAPSTAEPATLTVSDPGEEPLAPTLSVTGPDAVTAGDDVTLTATQDPATDLSDYRWSTRAPEALEFEPVEDATTDTLSVVATAADDGRQYRAAVYTAEGELVATSAPYTLAVSEDPGGEDPPKCDELTVLTDEHVDLISPVLNDDTELDLRAKVGTAADHTFYDPADLVVQVNDPEAAVAVPEGESYVFLGEAGDPLWMIPQTQNPEVVWAGWSTEELAPGSLRGDAVTMTLADVEGPGEVEVFQNAGLGAAPTRIFSSTDQLEPRLQSVGQHVHANWAFTALGEYAMTFEVSGTLPDGTAVTTGQVDYVVVVGDVECDPDEPGTDDGTDAGTDDGTDVGTDDGTEADGDASGDDDGTDAGGADAGGAETGGDESGDAGGGAGGEAGGAGGIGPKPTTKPTGEVCVPVGTRGSQATPGRSTTPDGRGDDNQAGDPVVLTNEHVDLLSPRLDGTALALRAKVGSANDHTFHDPADVLVQVGPAAASTVPGGDTYAFLGAAGAPLWLIPETQNPDVIWAGWSTEGLAAGALAGDTVDIRLVDVEGPGAVEVFQSSGFGDVARIFSSEDTLAPRAQSVGQHVHANWAFSAEGSYTLTFEVAGTLAGGGTTTTGPVEYSIVVGTVGTTGARGAAASSAPAASGTGAVQAAFYSAPTTTLLQADSTPTPTPTPTTSSPGTRPSVSASVTAREDCALAQTGSSDLPRWATVGGLLLMSGLVTTGAYWRRRHTALG